MLHAEPAAIYSRILGFCALSLCLVMKDDGTEPGKFLSTFSTLVNIKNLFALSRLHAMLQQRSGREREEVVMQETTIRKSFRIFPST